MSNKTEQLEHYLAKALGLLKQDKFSDDELRAKKIVISEIEEYFEKKFKTKLNKTLERIHKYMRFSRN
jgi:hypothetical protein